MSELNELAKKMPNHIIHQKCLWNGNLRIEIDHIDNDLNKPLDYLTAFKKMYKKVRNSIDNGTLRNAD